MSTLEQILVCQEAIYICVCIYVHSRFRPDLHMSYTTVYYRIYFLPRPTDSQIPSAHDLGHLSKKYVTKIG
jgi:hypothetical protein